MVSFKENLMNRLRNKPYSSTMKIPKEFLDEDPYRLIFTASQSTSAANTTIVPQNFVRPNFTRGPKKNYPKLEPKKPPRKCATKVISKKPKKIVDIFQGKREHTWSGRVCSFCGFSTTTKHWVRHWKTHGIVKKMHMT